MLSIALSALLLVGPPQELPTPGKELAWFKKDLGSWTATMKAFNVTTGEEVTSRGTETNRLGPGKMTLLTSYRGQFMGKPFVGQGMLGLNDANKLVASWTDNRSGRLRFLEGHVADDASKRVLIGESVHNKQVYKERHTVHWESPRRRRFTIETQGSDGKWTIAVEVTYVKRG